MEIVYLYGVGVICSILDAFIVETLIAPSEDPKDARMHFLMAFFWPFAFIVSFQEVFNSLILPIAVFSVAIASMFSIVRSRFAFSAFSTSVIVAILLYVYTFEIISRKSALVMALIFSTLTFGGQYIYYNVILLKNLGP